jgi:hypothetical protein
LREPIFFLIDSEIGWSELKRGAPAIADSATTAPSPRMEP